MKISFCTTCMGRQEHIEKTLLQNIKDNEPKNPGDPDVEFVLVQYGSKDNLKEMIENNAELKRYLDEGILVFAQYPEATRFHHAHAKNMAHRLATGDVVCNVDADNFTGKGFARYLAKQFAGGKHAIAHFSFSTLKGLANDDKGFFGRIAMRRDDFIQLGGYSETRFKNGWGMEDTDLITRAAAYGLKILPMFERKFMNTIPHNDAERVKNTKGNIAANQAKNSLIKPLKLFFNLYFTTVQTNLDGHFGEGRILGIDNIERVIPAVKTLVPISKRTLSAMWRGRKSFAKPPREKRSGLKASSASPG